MMNNIGIYIHVPFCVQKCKYCDFCSFEKTSEKEREDYTCALCNELVKKAKDAKKRRVDTVFFGGGTPSLLSNDQLARIFSCLRENYEIEENAEITLELNPATANKEKFQFLLSLGVNRLSIGMQSSSDGELSALGRIHTAEDFLSTFRAAREAGFHNINADVMYGIPHQTKESFSRTLDTLIAGDCEHISAYGLKIEENTPFFRIRDSLPLPTEDEEYEMYLLAAEKLKDAGYTHYEISNYAKNGKECLHNLRYWRAEEYLGFGVAAYSYFDGVRYGNERDIEEYIKNNGCCEKTDVEEIKTEKDRESEYIMLRFRLHEGICESDFATKFGVSFKEKYQIQLEKFLSSEYMKKEDERYFLTDKGMYVSNSILLEFI